MQYLTEPWQHQKKAVDLFADANECALFWEMGTGKSKGTIELLRYKYNKHKRHLNTLIIGPPIVVQNWCREFEIHSKIKRIHPLQGKITKRLEDAKEIFAKEGELGCTFITNYRALLNDEFFAWISKQFRPECIVLDEAHYIKDGQSKRTKRCVSLGKNARYKIILTGTPILSSPIDLFYPFKFLDNGRSFGSTLSGFRAKYFVNKNEFIAAKPYPEWVFRKEYEKEITERIEAKSMYVSKAECLDLPPLIVKEIPLELSDPQRKAYKEMKRDFVTYILDHRDKLLKPAVATLAVTKGLRLMQIASGFVNTEGGESVVFEKNPRVDRLREDLATLTPGHKVIIWAVFKENYKAIRKVVESLGLGDAYVEVHGGVSPKAREAAIARFTTDPTCRVFMGHPKSGGIGINLVSASYTIRYSKDFNLGDYLQSRDRNHRGGSEIHEKITHLEYVAENTLEEKITKALMAKQTISASILCELGKEL